MEMDGSGSERCMRYYVHYGSLPHMAVLYICTVCTVCIFGVYANVKPRLTRPQPLL